MRSPRCPNCYRGIVRRAPRRGRLDRILRHFRVVPFRCQLCSRRFRALRLGLQDGARAGDRREYDRVKLSLPVSVSFHHTRASGALVSLSLGGAEITTGFQPPAGALVQIEIGVPGGEPIAVDGALVRSARPGIVGVQFVWARLDSKERLRDLVLRGLGGDDVDEAMILVKGPGVRSALRLADFWVVALVAGAGLALLTVV